MPFSKTGWNWGVFRLAQTISNAVDFYASGMSRDAAIERFKQMPRCTIPNIRKTPPDATEK